MFDHQEVWQSYTPFHSAANVQEYLCKVYTFQNIEEPEKKSYQNCYPFIYYLDHGKSYYQLSRQAPPSIKPVLLFYGMTQLLKACLLSVDPEYPESTSVLAHGVSTRKRKKQSYDFLKDEVKIQKNGLFSHFSQKMFHVEHLDGEKIAMNSLFRRIPELNPLFKFSYGESVSLQIDRESELSYSITDKFLDYFHMTEERFISFLIGTIKDVQEVIYDNNQKKFIFTLQSKDLTPINSYPFYYQYIDHTYFLSTQRDSTTYFPEIMVHYLLLYNLSMISRYETEWWSELLQNASTKDLPFIQQFISTTTTKIPTLLSHYLYSKIE
ncbi:YaaC family protein [Bacillus pinisoli]|uniref:YaaC family protein n=1 Tax=Bacillus pinisoli TaxID=2901866 RepID=UPI001FF2361A|nr:YaaC family protein [Bacillus pinisoli]